MIEAPRSRRATAPSAPGVLLLAGVLAVGGACGTAAPRSGSAPTVAVAPVAMDATAGKRGVAERGMISSAHPAASDAGLEMLRRGGNAVDAAIAAAFAIGVVEPMMSGIGGGGNMLIWRQAERAADHLDFYASAPAGVDVEDPRLDAHPARMVAVPGAVSGLLTAHERFGVLSREAVLAPAIRLAGDGFFVSPLLARTVADDSALLARQPRVRALFLPGGRPLAPGDRLVQPELAETLRRIAALGAEGFYAGPVAGAVLDAVREGGNPMTARDLAGYAATWRRPVCGTYLGLTVLSAPPPQAGVQVIETLHLLERHGLVEAGLPLTSARAFHTLAAAIRTATADRQTHLGFPDSVAVPTVGLTAPAYADARTLDREAPRRVAPGDPWRHETDAPPPACARYEPFGPSPQPLGPSPQPLGPSSRGGAPGGGAPWSGAPGEAREDGVEDGETTHLVVVDAWGNAVSLTITQGAYFGSGAWAAGTFLNNAMSIFSRNRESPNRLRPGARPASATAPTIVLEPDGRVRLVVGSPGGGRIPPAIIQSMVYVLGYGLDPLEALGMPRIQGRYTTPLVDVEQGFTGEVLGEARALGYTLRPWPPLSLYFGGVHLIERRDGAWIGAADPRRDGQVRGY